MGIVVKCAALNVVTLVIAGLTMISALVAITPPRWLTFQVYKIRDPYQNLSSVACDKIESLVELSDFNHTGYSGLWQRCINVTSTSDPRLQTSDACFSIDGDDDESGKRSYGFLWACRIVYILSLLFWTVGIVSLIPWFSFEKKKQEKMFKLSSASFFIMAGLIFSSLLIYAGAHRKYCYSWTNPEKSLLTVERQEQSWAFQIAIITIMLAVFAGGVSLLAAFKMELSPDRGKRSASDPWSHATNASASTAAPSTSPSQFSNVTSNPAYDTLVC